MEFHEYRPGKGHFGTIKVNPHHSEAKRFLWDVKNNPRAMGMSINAVIRPGKRDPSGDVVVEELLDVRSVDVVTRPGTASGIFEQEEKTVSDLTAPEVADLRKALEEAQAQAKAAVAALEQERATREKADKKAKLAASVAKAVEGTPLSDLQERIVECACQMADPAEFEKLVGDMGALFVDDGKDLTAAKEQEESDAGRRAPQVGNRGQKTNYTGPRSSLGLKAR